MDAELTPLPFVEIFSQVADPRIHRTRKHDLIDILFAALCATLSGAEDFVAMADFTRTRLNFLRRYVKMRGGAPSHDTFSRVFALINPTQFSECFLTWTQTLQTLTNGEVIALDGKTLRHSFDTATHKAAIHMVSAWGALNGLVLGQVKVNAKSNEITAIPELLRLLDIAGSTITIDAMGTQKQIAAQIVEGGADYILAVKGNQPDLMADVEAFFERAHTDRFLDADANVISHDRSQTPRRRSRANRNAHLHRQRPARPDRQRIRVDRVAQHRSSAKRASYRRQNNPGDALLHYQSRSERGFDPAGYPLSLADRELPALGSGCHLRRGSEPYPSGARAAELGGASAHRAEFMSIQHDP